MSYNYEETTVSNGLASSGATYNAVSSGGVYAIGSALDANAFSTSSRSADATSRIASDLLLGAASGGTGSASAGFSASYGSSAGSALVAGNNSASLAYGSGIGAGGSSVYLSEIEQAILRSSDPININESEEITVNGQRGIWANRAEVVNWRGSIPITQYAINEDSNPELITKRTVQQLEYIQELAIRYLRPPTPPAPGEIIIQQQANTLTPPAPPLIIRQQPARPATPEPLVVREAPPQPPAQVGRKVITISGKRIPPPPRKVVIERLAPLPAKPQSVIIERWLPYSEVKRRVIFQKPAEADPVVVKPRNVIVQWEAPQVVVKKETKYLGVIRANPAEYVSRYGATLKQSGELPSFVTDIKTPDGLVLAANYRYNNLHELEGDVQALRLIDLDREGLAEYRSYLQRLGILGGNSSPALSYSAAPVSLSSILALADELLSNLNKNTENRISVVDAESAVLKLNDRLGRSYSQSDAASFFSKLDSNRDGYVDFDEFKKAFLSIY